MESQHTATIKKLTEQFIANFPEKRGGPRQIGREAEYPVVTDEGYAADVQAMWPLLLEAGDLKPIYEGNDLIVGLEGPDFTYSLEVGWGTMEVITGPCQDLHKLAEVHEAAMLRLRQAADKLGYHILGYGIQPRTPGELSLMSPKSRYKVLHDVIGPAWLHFTSTASDQVHIDINRTEIPVVHNVSNLLTPAVIALCANSPICGGASSGFHSAREGLMGEIHAAECRHGIPVGPIHEMSDWIEQLCDQKHLIHRENGQYLPQKGAFNNYLETHGPDFDAFLFHEHYIWNSARLRSAHGTVEFRAACQQPHHETMVVSAISLGIVEASQTLMTWLQKERGDKLWSTMRTYGHDVMRQGLAATEPIDNFLTTVLTQAQQALEQRGFKEEVFLEPLWNRLKEKKNPAQQALDAFDEGDVKALVKLRSHKTPQER